MKTRIIAVYVLIYIYGQFLFNMATPAATLRITAWNSRGMLASIPYIRDIMRNSDIICLSEHWLHRNRLYMLDEISNDFLSHAYASNTSSEDCYGVRRGTGGVAIMWRKTIPGVSPLLEVKHDRLCGIRVQLEKQQCSQYILCVYASCWLY